MSTLLLDTSTRVTYEFARLSGYNERWAYLVLAIAVAGILALAVWMVRRDAVELRPWVRGLLIGLRVIALLGMLGFYLHLEKRSERKVVHNSRVLMLVDTSLSMGLHDASASGVPATPNRLEQAVGVLTEGQLLDALRQKHDVSISRFDSELAPVVGFPKLLSEAEQKAKAEAEKKADKEADSPTPAKTDWAETLQPQGSETRLGQSLRQLISDERGTPISGIVVWTDGGQNAGIDTSPAVAAAREAKLPIFAVGIGADQRPSNVRVSDIVAPSRAYPDDSFRITGYLQADGLESKTVEVELTSRAADAGNRPDSEKVEGSERLMLGARGEIIPVKFEITPSDRGRRIYKVRVKPPAEDSNANDNQQEVDIEIVDRKNKVLLVASGPTREYVFLRNQLRRDKETIVDVWLQSGSEGISQDANKILQDFPTTPQELFEYDTIVAFDPDWQALDNNQIDLVERWVAEKAGGLIVVAGPVEMDRWVQDNRLTRVRGLYPVEFNRRISMVEEGRYGSTTPWPLDFTREGLEAEFLWLSETAPRSQQIWADFPGVYGYYGVRGVKPGATVYARYSDPDASIGGQSPVYLAGHFYGAGRVFYLASGEMWRLRALDPKYFEQIYTKLVRHVSQGRLLLGSSRGMLLVDRDRYLLGNTVVVRAQLSTPQFEPLDVASVSLRVVRPDSVTDTLRLTPDPLRKGMYVGQFTALQEGTYRLELAIDEGESEMLTRRIQVKVPDLERENPQRNDALLSEIAKRTGGLYYIGTDSVLGGRGQPALAEQLADRTLVSYLAGVTDRDFERNWMSSLLIVICGALCLEWLIRRLCKLA